MGSLIARSARLAHGAGATLPCLSLPNTFATTSGRPWVVPIFDLPVWARFAAFFPALMATVLLFLDQNITVRIVNNPSYKMTKGRRPKNVLDGMHADLLVISILTAIQSFFGMPWLVAATVRSISHVRALNKFDSTASTPTVKSTIEQRVTGTLIHTLIGCCVLFAKPRELLTNVPKAILMGLFMFLGTSALPGNEMWERLKGIFKQAPADGEGTEKWAKIDPKVVNGFTLIQCACLYAMFYVKESPIGVLFPVVIAMLAPLRFGLERFGVISKEDMDILDSE